VEMLADLRVQGCYIVPGVPNTTAVTQETDQNYGNFKDKFRANIRQLSQKRFDHNMGLTITDLPFLVFGGKCDKCGVKIENSFQEAFDHKSNLSVWKECGAVPLTRSAMHSNKVRHEVPTFGALTVQEGLTDISTERGRAVQKLKQLDAHNLFYCKVLTDNGYDGNKLRKEAPKRKTNVAVSMPNTLERQQAMKKASSAGQTFHATGGGHLNSDDFFKAAELKARENKVKAMEEIKKERAKYCNNQWAAIRLIKAKGELTLETEKRFTLLEIKAMLKWKKIKPTGTKKRDLVEAYMGAPKPKIQTIWSRSEEAALEALKVTDFTLQSTALGDAVKRMAKNLQNSLGNLDEASLKELESIIQARKDLENPNAL
jgi:hypothetical protein